MHEKKNVSRVCTNHIESLTWYTILSNIKLWVPFKQTEPHEKHKNLQKYNALKKNEFLIEFVLQQKIPPTEAKVHGRTQILATFGR